MNVRGGVTRPRLERRRGEIRRNKIGVNGAEPHAEPPVKQGRDSHIRPTFMHISRRMVDLTPTDRTRSSAHARATEKADKRASSACGVTSTEAKPACLLRRRAQHNPPPGLESWSTPSITYANNADAIKPREPYSGTQSSRYGMDSPLPAPTTRCHHLADAGLGCYPCNKPANRSIPGSTPTVNTSHEFVFLGRRSLNSRTETSRGRVDRRSRFSTLS